MVRYQVLEHTADLAIKASGKTLEKLFSNLAYGLCEVMSGKRLLEFEPEITRKIEVSGEDKEVLVINFLNEILYLSDIHSEIYLDFSIKIKNKTLECEVKGIKLPKSLEVKAATFHDLKIKKENSNYETTIIFDI